MRARIRTQALAIIEALTLPAKHPENKNKETVKGASHYCCGRIVGWVRINDKK
jgi:hypothetical protein